MVRLTLSKDPDSYTSCSVATGTVGNDSDNKEYPGLPGWGFGVKLKHSPP